jgi:hypothetical protein
LFCFAAISFSGYCPCSTLGRSGDNVNGLTTYKTLWTVVFEGSGFDSGFGGFCNVYFYRRYSEIEPKINSNIVIAFELIAFDCLVVL